MEESQAHVFEASLNSAKNLTKVYDSIKQKTLKSSTKTQGQGGLSQTDAYNEKNFKPMLIHKRRLSNNNTLGLQANQNVSTDYEDENYTISKTLFKKIQSSYILKDFEVLYSFFSFEVDFRLLFRASDHHFSTQKFHELCDYQTNTITLCKTKSNQIIGGYTPLPWVEDFQDNRTYFKTDKDNETFLFSINKKQKYHLAKSKRNKAICCFRSYGPTFGGGYDLQIGNRADQTYSSASYFPRSFTCESKQVTQKHLTGSKNKEFKILEWQVYKVTKRIEKKQKRKSIEELKLGETEGIMHTFKKGLEGLFFLAKSKQQENEAQNLN